MTNANFTNLINFIKFTRFLIFTILRTIIPQAFFEKYKKILPKEEFDEFEKSCYR